MSDKEKHGPHDDPHHEHDHHDDHKKKKKKRRGGGGLVLFLILLLIILLALMWFFRNGFGLGQGTGDSNTGTNDSSNTTSSSSNISAEPVSDVTEIRIDQNDIFIGSEKCADEQDLKNKITDAGSGKKYKLEHKTAIEETYNKVKQVLLELKDALNLEIDFNE